MCPEKSINLLDVFSSMIYREGTIRSSYYIPGYCISLVRVKPGKSGFIRFFFYDRGIKSLGVIYDVKVPRHLDIPLSWKPAVNDGNMTLERSLCQM